MRASRLAARCDKLSSEVDVLSQRLVHIETVARAIAEQQVRAADAGNAPPDRLLPDTSHLSAGIEEVTAEIGLLSGIVRELAAVVAAQDGEIAGSERARPLRRPPCRPGNRSPARRPFRWPRRVEPAIPPWTPRIPGRTTAPRDPDREAALLGAFDAQGLEIHLQPIVSLPQRKVASYEALARLRVAGEVVARRSSSPCWSVTGGPPISTAHAAARCHHRPASGRARQPGGGGYGLSPRSLFEPGFLRSLGRLVEGEPDFSRAG